MNILLWLIFGVLVGVAAYSLEARDSRVGLMGTIILGVLGTFVGGFMGNYLFGVSTSGYNLTSFFIAALGAIVILFVGRVFQQEI